jgi:hypothetical protein
MEFLTLQFPFTKRGFRHELVARQGLICAVRRTRIYPDGERGPSHFEVVRLRQANEWTAPNGQTVPAAENYPSNESWGKEGWTYRTEVDALREYRLLSTATAPGAFQARKGENPLETTNAL